MQFKFFVEMVTDLHQLVSMVIHNRYDRGIRLIVADWLEENGEGELSDLFRLAQMFNDPVAKARRQEIIKSFNDIYFKLREIYNLDANGHLHISQYPHEYYHLVPNGIGKTSFNGSHPEAEYSKVNIEELSYNQCKAFLVVLAKKMFIYSTTNKEAERDLEIEWDRIRRTQGRNWDRNSIDGLFHAIENSKIIDKTIATQIINYIKNIMRNSRWLRPEIVKYLQSIIDLIKSKIGESNEI